MYCAFYFIPPNQCHEELIHIGSDWAGVKRWSMCLCHWKGITLQNLKFFGDTKVTAAQTLCDVLQTRASWGVSGYDLWLMQCLNRQCHSIVWMDWTNWEISKLRNFVRIALCLQGAGSCTSLLPWGHLSFCGIWGSVAGWWPTLEIQLVSVFCHPFRWCGEC